jgi:phosphonate transport system substrate-binding protein
MNRKTKFTVLSIVSLAVLNMLPILPFGVCLGEEKSEQLNSQDRTLHLVLVPEQNVFEQRRRYKFISDYLSRKMELNVIVEIMANYGETTDAFMEGSADAGFFGSFSYVLTHAKAGIEPIARPVWLDGSSTYRGYIFARKDSGIETVKDMKNKSLVLVDKATTAGYIFQLFYFKYHGISKLEDYFSKISYARSHDAAVWAVYTGEADIGGAKNHIFNRFKEEYPDFQEQMVVLAESPEVPSNGLAVRNDLNPAIKLRLKNLLLTLHETTEGQKVLKNFGALKFIETTDEDYKPLYNMIQKLGIDLREYSYK